MGLASIRAVGTRRIREPGDRAALDAVRSPVSVTSVGPVMVVQAVDRAVVN